MMCAGISQNTKHHQLTLYRGQVWREKSYTELCNHNLLDIVFDSRFTKYGDIIESWNRELYVPPVPGKAFTDGRANGLGFNDRYTQIPYESEILQSFVTLTASTYITLQKWEAEKNTKQGGVEYQIKVGNWRCTYRTFHKEQCASLKQYDVWYIWTKEGFKIKTFF